MNPADFQNPEAGRVIQTPQGYAAFVPAPPPPKLTYDAELTLALSHADAALSEPFPQRKALFKRISHSTVKLYSFCHKARSLLESPINHVGTKGPEWPGPQWSFTFAREET